MLDRGFIHGDCGRRSIIVMETAFFMSALHPPSVASLTQLSAEVNLYNVNHTQILTISKSSLRALHSGQVQLGGISSHRVPAGKPSSGSPFASS